MAYYKVAKKCFFLRWKGKRLKKHQWAVLMKRNIKIVCGYCHLHHLKAYMGRFGPAVTLSARCSGEGHIVLCFSDR